MGETNTKDNISENEKRVRAITKLYYSNPKVQEAIVKFAKDREVVPRYFEGFGKRPDMLQYPSDVMGLVNKGATSFHCSEEIWTDPLKINSDIGSEQLAEIRKSWDLLIDIDSKYLDMSKEAAKLVIEFLEHCGIKNYNLKFSVAGDTPIMIKIKDKTKLIPIKEAIALLKSGKEVKTLSLDKQNRVTFSKVYDSLEHEDELYEIKYENSKIPLKTTKHHSVFILKDGQILQKKVSDLKERECLITFNSSKKIKKTSPQKIDYLFTFNNKIENRSVVVNSSLMRLIGYYLAEGHVTNIINQVGFSFNKNERKYVEDCVNLLWRITKRKISIRHPNENSTQILIHSKEWSSFFELLCGKSKGKHLPYFCWDISKELFLEMLKGYMRGDGYKSGEYSIAAKSVVPQMIRELVWLCKLNGISCSLSSEQNKPHILPQGNFFKGSFVYILKIPKSELQIKEFYRGRVKFSPYPRDRTIPIEGLRKVYRQIKPGLFNYHRAEQMTLKKQRANFDRIKKVIDWFKKCKTCDFTEESLEIMKNYELLSKSDIGIVRVKSIKYLGREMVYDISVKDTEAFFGNDYPILLHNSGSKGFHIIVSGKAFPEDYEGRKMKDCFPEWPRAITEYIFYQITPEFRKRIGKKMSLSPLDNSKAISSCCKRCQGVAGKGSITKFRCPVCGLTAERKDYKLTKKRLRCLNERCAGVLEVLENLDYYFCKKCIDPDNEKLPLSSNKYPELFERIEVPEEHTKLDLILVSPRHLFRMPYSLHEKTALASIVLKKEQLDSFLPRYANPLGARILEYLPKNEAGEAKKLLVSALEWKRNQISEEEEKDKYKNYDDKIEISGVTEEMFPKPIKKLLKGLKDGKKRGLFILIAFLKSLNFSPEFINARIREWNKLNEPQLKEGYIKSQIDWHLKQKKKILPPNYSNESFYKDLGLLDEKPNVKNPIVDVLRALRKSRENF